MEVFSSEKVTDHVTRIFGNCSELMYLVEGSEKALLIDTGCGVGSLKSYVDRLTSKDVEVVLTHGHADHAFGAAEFERVWMNHLDDEVYRAHSDFALRKEFVEAHAKNDAFADEDYVKPVPTADFLELTDGSRFELGGISVVMYACPGHTLGSMVAFMEEEELLLLGDACNYFTFLFGPYAAGVATYKRSLERIEALLHGRYSQVLSSHRLGTLDRNIIADSLGLCDDVLQGRTDDIPFSALGWNGFLAKKTKSAKLPSERADGGIANMIYSKEKIFE